jgi:hypothetical protein
MHYWLYFPGTTGITNEHLERVGLADLARGQAPVWFEPERGPDGKRGMCCTWQRGNGDDPPLAMLPSQAWTPCRPATIPGGTLAKGAYWVGIDRDRPPRPEDLERKEVFCGHTVPLRDRQGWTVPTAVRLPHTHGLGEDGQYCRVIQERFADFWKRSEAYARELLTLLRQVVLLSQRPGTKPTDTLRADFDIADTFAFAVEALAINYRINAEIVTQLDLLDDAGLLDVVKATVDLPTLIGAEREKKTAGSGPARELVSIPVGLST